jgi:secreted PhoX family phosphatase
MGQVWEIDPKASTLRLVFESPGPDVLNMPDNICVSPRGGLVICEDGTVRPCVHGLTRDGRIFRFARNNMVLPEPRNGVAGDFTTSEFAGATYSPDGRWLFVNAQRPGVTFAITGPWDRGGL